MVSIRFHLAVFSAKCTKLGLRILGRGATTLPGKVAVKVDPKILEKLCSGRNCVTITGTNGKTTTTHMITDIFRNCGYTVVTNVSGAYWKQTKVRMERSPARSSRRYLW